MTRYATIIATGRYIPPIERPNAQMREKFGEVIDKFEASSGIKTRFYAPDDWATSDLAVEAEIIKVTNYNDIMAYPILSTPGLVINEQVVSSGRIPSIAEVTTWITNVLS